MRVWPHPTIGKIVEFEDNIQEVMGVVIHKLTLAE